MSPTKGISRRAMLGAIPALGFTGAAFAQPPAAPTGARIGIPEEQDITSTLDAWVDTYGRPTAKVKLDGKGPYNFMVDTGSTTTVIAQRVATALATPIVGTATVLGTTGEAVTPVGVIRHLMAGVVERSDIRVAVLSDANLARADGILGADVFAGKRLVFNIQGKVVRIESSNRQRTAPMGNMKVRNGLLAEVQGKVGNVSATLMLDTGAQNCIANPALSTALRRAHPLLERIDNVKVVGVTGHTIIGQFIALPKVDLKAFLVKDATAVAADAPIFRVWGLEKEPAMIVGVNLLSRLSSFSIDYGARVFDATLLSELIARNNMALG